LSILGSSWTVDACAARCALDVDRLTPFLLRRWRDVAPKRVVAAFDDGSV
jgi:hypothetical protein